MAEKCLNQTKTERIRFEPAELTRSSRIYPNWVKNRVSLICNYLNELQIKLASIGQNKMLWSQIIPIGLNSKFSPLTFHIFTNSPTNQIPRNSQRQLAYDFPILHLKKFHIFQNILIEIDINVLFQYHLLKQIIIIIPISILNPGNKCWGVTLSIKWRNNLGTNKKFVHVEQNDFYSTD